MGHRLRREGHAGQDLVEYALILPLLLTLLFGIVEFGWAVFAYNTVSNAAREVARCCIYPSPTLGQLSRCDQTVVDPTPLQQCEEAAIARFSTAVGLRPGTPAQGGDFTYIPDVSSRTVQVVVEYDHRLITGYIAGVLGMDPSTATLTFRTAATMRVE